MRFEPGKSYQTRSTCDNDCIYTIEVLSRTDKTVQYREGSGRVRRSKVHSDADGEWIRPDNYSMSAVYRACRERA